MVGSPSFDAWDVFAATARAVSDFDDADFGDGDFGDADLDDAGFDEAGFMEPDDSMDSSRGL